MVRILDNPTSNFSERLSRGLHAAVPHVSKGLEKYAETKKKDAQALDKRIKGARKFSDDALKRFHPGIYENEKPYNSFNDRMKQYVQQGYSDDDALRASLADISKQRADAGGTLPGEARKSGHGNADKDKFIGGWLGKYLDPAKEAIQKDPSILAREVPVAALKSAENLAALHDPASTLIRMFSKNKPVTASGLAAQKLREGVDPELHEGSERVSDIGSFLLDLFTPLPKGAKVPGIAEKAGAQIVPKIAEREAAKLAQGAVSKELPKGATVSRLGRLAPEGKLFKKAEQEAVREQQLKLFPKYAEEIASDASERAARMEAKIPKTAVGEAGVAKRMAIGEAELPKAKNLYQKAIARVRGLEESLAKGIPVERKAAAESLYDMAVKELNDAEFYLKTVVNNAKTGEARVGLDQMRQAARNKLIKIEDEILSGHEAKLSLKDYNPEIIKKAKALEKKRSLPVSRHEDYFTQVHEGYANEYRQRLMDLDKEIEKLKTVQGISPLQRGIQINREKEVVQKLIDHIDAENAVHRHKMALRETGQRQVAKERLGQFTKQAGEQRVKDLAKEALKSPEKAAEATEAAFEQAISGAKTQAERDALMKEKSVVQGRLEQEASKINQGTGLGKAIEESSNGATTPKEAAAKSNRLILDLKEVMESLKSGGKNFFQTRIGKDFLWGIGSEIVTQISKGEDLPITPSTLTAIAGGRRGGVYRYAFAQMTRWIWRKGQKNEYKKAIREGDDEKLIQLRSKMAPKLRKEAIEEYRQETSS